MHSNEAGHICAGTSPSSLTAAEVQSLALSVKQRPNAPVFDFVEKQLVDNVNLQNPQHGAPVGSVGRADWCLYANGGTRVRVRVRPRAC